MDSSKIITMIAAAKNANHVGEFPANFYIPMPNRLGAVHSVDDLKEILELRSQVEQLRNAGKSVFFKWNKGLHLTDAMHDLYKAFDAIPVQCLAEVRALIAEEYYCMGWEHSLSTKSDDGDHYACGKRLAKEFANQLRQQVKTNSGD